MGPAKGNIVLEFRTEGRTIVFRVLNASRKKPGNLEKTKYMLPHPQMPASDA